MTTDDPAPAQSLAAAYEAGATLEGLVKKTGLSYHAVRDNVLAAGVTLRPPRILIPECPPGMIDQYYQGASIRQLADKHDRTYSQTRRMLLQAGVSLRPRGRR
ncbi:helix-turn-helix domain-containing protein [Amycolatopsis thailandensis]|uniref:helix-turn-helix domain-containing protein n=1 Tax=Amycolatopsis thailandensis TaxID=589330 RepID=UPI0037BA23FC